MIASEELIGRKFGRLTVVGRKREKNVTYLQCRCDCGNKKWYNHGNVVNGRSSQCRKCRNESSRSPGYGTDYPKIHAQIQRSKFKISPKWKKRSSFVEFMLEQHGRKKPKGYLRPVDYDQPIGPDNYHWAVKQTKACKVYDYRGESGTIPQLAKKLGLSRQFLYATLAPTKANKRVKRK